MRHPLSLIASTIAAGCIAVPASSSFVGFVVTSVNVTNSGQNLRVYSVFARFNGPTDTMLNCFNLGSSTPGGLVGYWHKDNAEYNSGALSQEFGTWNPSQTGSITANRPFDSYLTVGGQATGTNTSSADPSWVTGGNTDARSWNRPDLPNTGTLGWYNSSRPNLQGRVGTPPNTATDVRIGQFVLSVGHTARTMTLTIGYNDGIPGSAVQFGTNTFDLAGGPCGTIWYRDADGDGFGSSANGTSFTCSPTAGYVSNNFDCNDSNATISPNTVWFADIDGDGIGYAADGTATQCAQPTGYRLTNGDNCPDIANANQADINSNGIGDVCEFARGDLNLDGIVNASDVPLFFNAWGSTGASPADFNFDGVVNAADFSILLGNWGTTP